MGWLIRFICAVAAAATDEAGTKFLAENAAKEGVITTASGLQYKILESGSGTQADKVSTCTAHYKGSLVDGTVFDSSYDRGTPLVIKPSQVIKGWGEALELMREGDKWELVIPSELGYGAKGAGDKIPADAALIFEVELIKVEDTLEEDESADGMPSMKKMADDMLKMANETLELSAKREGVKLHPSGLQYTILRSGDDDARRPEPGTKVEINYEISMFLNPDKVADSTYKRGESELVGPDEVLIGMKLAISMMRAGDKWELVLPHTLGFGAEPAKGMPPYSVLRVLLELVAVVEPSPPITELTDIEPVNVTGMRAELGEDLACHACIYTGRLLKAQLAPLRGGKKQKRKAEMVLKAFKGACKRSNLPSGVAVHEHEGRKSYTDWREMMRMGKMWDAVELKTDEKHAADILSVCKQLKTAMALGLAKGAARSDDRIQHFDFDYWMCGPKYTQLCPRIYFEDNATDASGAAGENAGEAGGQAEDATTNADASNDDPKRNEEL